MATTHPTSPKATGRTLPRPVSDGPANETGRDRILRVAAELFLTGGYAETSIRIIADAVDMRPASIYHHFASKDALLAEILDIGMNAVTEAFETASNETANAQRTGHQLLEAHVAAHLRALFAHHAFTAAHVTVFPFVPASVRSAAVPQRDAYEAKWTALLKSIAPTATPETLRLTRLALFGAMNSAVQWFDSSESSADELATALVATLWNGLGTLAEPSSGEAR